jgi:hypothetical protein
MLTRCLIKVLANISVDMKVVVVLGRDDRNIGWIPQDVT